VAVLLSIKCRKYQDLVSLFMCHLLPFTLSNVFHCYADPHNYDRLGGFVRGISYHIVGTQSNLLPGTPT
jgi:hypothetical protein